MVQKLQTKKGRKNIDWSAVEDLGYVPDRVIAERLGCREISVYYARKRLGIAPYPQKNSKKSYKIQWDLVSDLGKCTDEDLARRFGCTRAAVIHARKVRRIPAYAPVKTIDWDSIDEMDKISVAQVAKKLGCSRPAVYKACARKGISGKFKEKHGRKKKTESRATTRTVSMPDIVWERLDKACADKGVLRSRVIQEAINAWLDANIQLPVNEDK